MPTTITITPLPHNQVQQQKRLNKAKEAALAMRRQLWPDVPDERLWMLSERTRKGFAQIPRTIPLLMNIIGDAHKRQTGRSIPAGRAYLALWCRDLGEGMVKVDNEATLAAEAGYPGERNLRTWRQHLQALKSLGFIDTKGGQNGTPVYVLLFNPYHVVKTLWSDGFIPEPQYTTFYQRALDISAASELA